MTAIWRKEQAEWRALLPSGFPSEEALHDLVEDAPHLLPLSGDPSLVVVGREVALGPGWADLVAVEADGRLVIIEIKLRRNAEARRAVVAQILTYAAYLRSVEPEALESQVLWPHFAQREFDSLAEAVQAADQSGQFDGAAFADGVAASLASGAFRLVLVLDEAPAELVQLVGYLESVSSGIVLDLVTVAAYEVGNEQVLVPTRVDPEHVPHVVPAVASPSRRAARPKPIDGTEPFEQALERAPSAHREPLRRLLEWAKRLEERQLATLKTVLGDGRQILLVWLPAEKAGLVSIWNDGGPYLSLWRTVFVRHAWESIEPIERASGVAIGQGNTVRDPSDGLLDLIAAAYERAAQEAPAWDGRSHYVAFGDGPHRDWDDAREYGFVSAGGGAWYSRSLRQLKPGHRIFVYVPKGNGVGGYVGVGEVTGDPVMAKEFLVPHDGQRVPITQIARAPQMSRGDTDDPDISEWVVPVKWLETRAREDAVKDSDLFANQNSAVKLTHGYTLKRLSAAFGLDHTADAPGR